MESSCYFRKSFFFVVSLFKLESFFFLVKVGVALFKLESLVFQIQVRFILFYLESIGTIYSPPFNALFHYQFKFNNIFYIYLFKSSLLFSYLLGGFP